MMNVVQRVSRTELARNTRRVLSDVQRGRTALIENYGEPEAALLDIVDYRILQAVMRAYADMPEIAADAGLSEGAVRALEDLDARYGLVFAHYLTGSISLARAAELLEMPWLELRTRCLRLNVPLRVGPGDAAEAAADVAAAADW
jgi:predicted HTH domain antitoxin